jgi:hypothetical protein
MHHSLSISNSTATLSSPDCERCQISALNPSDTHPTTSTSSPISAVRTPPDYSASMQIQHPQFAKQLENAAFDLDAASQADTLHSYHGRYHGHAGHHVGAARVEMVVPNDPFGLDASLFSI